MKFFGFCLFFLKILSGNEILAIIKGHNSCTNVQKMICNNPKLDLVNINAYIKFGEILSICSQGIELKQNFGVIKGHNSGTNVRKMMCNNPNLLNLVKVCQFVLKILSRNKFV